MFLWPKHECAAMCFRLKARSPLDLVAVTTSGWCATCWRAWENRSLSLRYVSMSIFLLTHCLWSVSVSIFLRAHCLSAGVLQCPSSCSLSVSGLCQCPSSCELTVSQLTMSVFLLAQCLWSVSGVLQCLSCFSSTVCLWSVSMSIFLLVSCLSAGVIRCLSCCSSTISVSLPARSSTVQWVCVADGLRIVLCEIGLLCPCPNHGWQQVWEAFGCQ